ncbi:amino acid adenylation domain-containing protein [Archangium violaceum]|uniref:non-ribosomal peptide synthetase n=1 Tax=Archangium violaceum TaxID=83451 RepID=UPI002B303A4D|nr:non-ribosomal peptide synthetase [Archangium gephyra]WPB75850.1 amino acid adenylation domain-containing protein [Archangium gephyra]
MAESLVKQTLESLRLKGIDAADDSLPEIHPGGGGSWILSSSQQRMLFLEQLEPGNASQHLLQAWLVRGPLDARVLQQAVDVLFRRHEALRLVMVPGAATPQQRLGEAPSLELALSDLSAADRPREALAELVREDARAPFIMDRGPLLRLRLTRLEPQLHALVLTIHHILSDGAWTGEIFVKELTHVYEQLIRGEAPHLPALPVQYGDYVTWAARTVIPGAAEEEAWRRRLDGFPPVLELPADGHRPPRQTFRAGRVEVTVPPALRQTLEALAAREGVTLFSLLLTAFTTLLHRHSRQEELVVGWPAPLRQRPELRGLIGYFGNPVPLRSRMTSGTRGLDAARAMDQEVREANALATLPFERLVALLGVERDPSRHPLYQVMFDLLPAQPPLAAGGCTVEPLDVFSGLVAYDATLLLEPREGGLVGALDFNADLFGQGRMERLAGQYLHLLHGLAAEPGAPLRALPMLSEPEQRTLLEETTLGPAVEGADVAVLERFEQQVRRTPHAPALAFGARELTYDELNRRANQLAHALRRMGVGPDTLVALCVERSLELPMALLAIWKAGGGFLPLDVNNPRERLAFLLADAGVRAVLTQEHLLARLPGTDAPVLCVDRDAERISREPAENLPPRAGLDHLAYVIHTSGSTGTPKGIAMVHRCLANLVDWQLTHPRLGGVSRTLQFASLNFDICYQELFTTWAVGGTVIMVTEEVRRDAARLLDVLEQERVSRLYLPFIALQQLARVADERGAAPRHLRQLITAGEQLQATPELQRLLTRMPECSLHNQYGPSECHVVTSHDLAREPSAWPRLPPIGRPVAHLRLLLLDAWGQPVPRGVPGEVFLGGPALARGYLGRPAQTAERFVPHPFEPGARLYRTGDLARLREDGELEFLQRVDAQVKIRGFRIEPGEIEVALSEHPSVEQAHVRPYVDTTGERRLVAYVAARLESPTAEGAEVEHVGRWRSVWDETYRHPEQAEDGFDLSGWNDSVRGEPLPAEVMREWVEATVSRIRSLGPRRVLEVGCGSGLLLHRLAPECESYWGTDLSDVTIRRLEARLRTAHAPLAQRVRLETRPAEDFSGLPEAAFDTVILNSVTQLFPSVDYLRRFIEGALRLLTPGGCLFVGDVQNLRLFELFHASVVLAQAPAEQEAAPLLGRVRQRMLLDERLYVDPAFFPALVGQVPLLGAVDVRLKRGSGGNEMNRFRYDVMLWRSPVAEAPSAGPPSLDWEREGLSLERVRRMLEERPSGLLLRRVPNARTADDASRLALLRSRGTASSVGRLMALPAVAACEPEALCRLAESMGLKCHLDWSAEGEEGRFDALLTSGPARWVPAATPRRPWRDYANAPLLASQRQALLGELRTRLEHTLPEYMVPSAFVLLSELPRKPTGKLDVPALPPPEPVRAEHAATHQAPRTPTERKLAELWRRVLGVQRVGANDDFFQLGGHSLLATRLLSLIRGELGLELPLRVLFEQSTLATMAGCMDARSWLTGPAPAPQAGEEGEI